MTTDDAMTTTIDPDPYPLQEGRSAEELAQGGDFGDYAAWVEQGRPPFPGMQEWLAWYDRQAAR